MVDNHGEWKKPPPPLKKRITCTTTKCEAGFHSFQTNMRKKENRENEKSYRNDSCSCCGENLVDWKRIDKRDLKDSEYLISKLKLEMFRNDYWKKPFDDEARKKLKNKTLSDLRNEAESILRKALTKPRHKQFRDGIQTKLTGNVIYYAQHATATCCRKCLEEWHGVDKKNTLDEKNLKYALDLIIMYIQKRLPEFIEKENQKNNQKGK